MTTINSVTMQRHPARTDAVTKVQTENAGATPNAKAMKTGKYSATIWNAHFVTCWPRGGVKDTTRSFSDLHTKSLFYFDLDSFSAAALTMKMLVVRSALPTSAAEHAAVQAQMGLAFATRTVPRIMTGKPLKRSSIIKIVSIR